jgi:hypothetical protein
MPNNNVSFGGQTLVLPGAYYQDQLSGFNPGVPTTPPLIYIGYGYGVKPQTPSTYITAADLLAAIRGGPASGYVPPLTNPSPQLFGAQVITFINVGENTQSSLVFKNAAGSGVAVATSANYGVPSNLLQASVGTGSLAGKLATVYDGYSGRAIQGDNLGIPFQLAYTGAATGGVSFTVTTSGLNATVFAVTSPNTNESFSINLAPGQYTTVERVVEYLNGTGFYSAIPIGDTSLPAAYLDAGQTTVALPPVSGTAYQYANVSAWLGSFIYWFNQYAAQSFATAAASASVASYTSGLVPANTPFASFAGATSTPPTNNDYATALNLALAIPGWSVFCDSNIAAVRALGSQHCQTASTPLYGKWRRFYTGSSPGDSVASAIANAQALNSNRSIYVYPGIYAVDTNTGATVLQGGLFAAAGAAGMSTGNPASTPLTNKVLNGVGVEAALTISQVDQLQQAGVMPLKGTTPPVSGQINFNNIPPTIISDLTTWQNDNNPENVFEQQIKCRDFLAYSMVNALQPYVGTVAEVTNEAKMLQAAQLTLNSLIYTPGSQGVLASWDPTSLIVNYNGNTQTASVSASVRLVGQNRFILETVTIFPLNFSLSLSSPAA